MAAVVELAVVRHAAGRAGSDKLRGLRRRYDSVLAPLGEREWGRRGRDIRDGARVRGGHTLELRRLGVVSGVGRVARPEREVRGEVHGRRVPDGRGHLGREARDRSGLRDQRRSRREAHGQARPAAVSPRDDLRRVDRERGGLFLVPAKAQSPDF